MAMTRESILERDAELTNFMRYALENPNDLMTTIVDTFDFRLLNVSKHRDRLISVGNIARRYPHRIPPK